MLSSLSAALFGGGQPDLPGSPNPAAALLPTRGAGVAAALRQLSGSGPAEAGADEEDSADGTALYEADVGRKEFSHGPDSEETLAAVVALAQKLTRDGEQARAVAVWRRAAETDAKLHGIDSASALETLYGYANALGQAGEVADAERSFALLAAHLGSRFGETHPATLRATAGHALALQVRSGGDVIGFSFAGLSRKAARVCVSL